MVVFNCRLEFVPTAINRPRPLEFQRWHRSALSPKPGYPLRHRCRSTGRSSACGASTTYGSAWPKGPEFDDYASGSGQFAERALRRLSDRLLERRGPASG